MRSICLLLGRPLGSLVLALLLFTTTGAALAQSEYKPSPITKVVLLGTGTPLPDPDRSGPSVAIVVNDTPYLVDLGPGVIRRGSAAFRKGVKGLQFFKLKTAFITHLHSDHTVGYPDFIFTPWVLGRTRSRSGLWAERHQGHDGPHPGGVERGHPNPHRRHGEEFPRAQRQRIQGRRS